MRRCDEDALKYLKLIQTYCKVFQLTTFPNSDIRQTTDENFQTKGFDLAVLKLFLAKW